MVPAGKSISVSVAVALRACVRSCVRPREASDFTGARGGQLNLVRAAGRPALSMEIKKQVLCL